MKIELITDAGLDAQLNELAALRGLEPDKLLHYLALKGTAQEIGTQLARARYHAHMNGAYPKAFDYETAKHKHPAYTPIDWGAVDRPAPPRYAPIEWPAQPNQNHTKAGDGIRRKGGKSWQH